MRKYIFIYLIVLVFFTACAGQNTSPTPTSVSGPLRDLAQKRGILLGAAVDMDVLYKDERYHDVLAREFNAVAAENVMKFKYLQPQRGQYDFAQADALVDFAQHNEMQVRGHTLVWHREVPDWVMDVSLSREQIRTILKEHITTVVTRYRERINIWDVVNEAIGDESEIRPSTWQLALGTEYIDLAFRWAHKANPQARLFYNDYGAEGMNAKSDAVYALVKGMKERGVPIHGVGLQMHFDIANPPVVKDVQANIKRLADLGLEVQITELDVQIWMDKRSLQDRLQAQSHIYSDMLKICLSTRACTAFVLWGFTDRYTWVRAHMGYVEDAPLIFDDRYRPKPAYQALVRELAL